MDCLFIKICVVCAVLAWAWVDQITNAGGLLQNFPKKYPDKLTPKPLNCAYCVGGWLSFFMVSGVFVNLYGYYNIRIYFYMAFAPFMGMAIVQLIRGGEYR